MSAGLHPGPNWKTDHTRNRGCPDDHRLAEAEENSFRAWHLHLRTGREYPVTHVHKEEDWDVNC